VNSYLPLAVIREAECIGCTKCIQACPLDVIIGAAQQMHTIIAQDCTGCGLCVPVCPVDCIDIIDIPMLTVDERQVRARHAKQRVAAKQRRLTKKKSAIEVDPLATRKTEIAAALARAKNKIQNK